MLCDQLGRCKSGWLYMEEGWPSAAPVFWSTVWMENRILSYLMIYVKTCQCFSMPWRETFPTEICISALALFHARPRFSATSLFWYKDNMSSQGLTLCHFLCRYTDFLLSPLTAFRVSLLCFPSRSRAEAVWEKPCPFASKLGYHAQERSKISCFSCCYYTTAKQNLMISVVWYFGLCL